VAFLLTDVIRYNTDDSIEIDEGMQAIINVGSVGQPRDGNPDASVVIYDTDKQCIDRYRISYDIQAVQEKIIACGLPEFLAERLAEGR
ncbi:MAG: metallophosphoesterase, partial [Planctomycetota bacterium]